MYFPMFSAWLDKFSQIVWGLVFVRSLQVCADYFQGNDFFDFAQFTDSKIIW